MPYNGEAVSRGIAAGVAVPLADLKFLDSVTGVLVKLHLARDAEEGARVDLCRKAPAR